MASTSNRYQQIIQWIFERRYQQGAEEVAFDREDIEAAASDLGIKLPKNLGDVIYSFRYRVELPESVQRLAPEGKQWIIRPGGRGRYRFSASQMTDIEPTQHHAETKILDATPGLISEYALNDEQALLAKVRYNRLVDTFSGVTCYSLQNHLRTAVPDIGQIETDELYIGVDQRGAQYVFPVQAKGGDDKINIVQIEQDFALCRHRFPMPICRPIATQFIEQNLIAMFIFEHTEAGPRILNEKHYRLVSPGELSDDEIRSYQQRPLD